MIIDCSRSQNSIRGFLTDESHLCIQIVYMPCCHSLKFLDESVFKKKCLTSSPMLDTESGGKSMSNMFFSFPSDHFFLNLNILKKSFPGPSLLGDEGEIVVKWESSWLSSPRLLLLLPTLLAFLNFILLRALGDSAAKILLQEQGSALQGCD